MPKVSVIMSVYNGGRYLSDAIDSILSQSFRDFELVIINDGSTDNSEHIIQSYADDRIVYVYQENAGLPAALNRGLTLAKGALVARMDADDISLLHRLEEQVAYMDAHPNCDILGGQAILIDSHGNVIGYKQKPVDSAIIAKAIRWGCPVIHPTYLVRYDVYAKVGNYRNAITCAEDYDFLLRAFEAGCVIHNLQSHLIKYRISPVQMRPEKERLQMLQTRLLLKLHHARKRTGVEPISVVKRIQCSTPTMNRWFSRWAAIRNACLLRLAQKQHIVERKVLQLIIICSSCMHKELFLSSYRGFRYKRIVNKK